MPQITTENTFETAIVQHLLEHGGYTEGNPQNYSRELALFKSEVISFLQESQSQKWKKSENIHGADVENRIIQRLFKELDLRGSLDVLRNGFKDFGVHYQMAYFKPETSLNTETLAQYAQNRLQITRQVHYSTKNENSVDLVFSLNGIPIATAELKNHFTGQTTQQAKKQFHEDRDPRELLFQFKKRALVHFAVDPDEVYMTTKLAGVNTYFLPFNLGNNNGAGNPNNANGYKTYYLWENIWRKDSWLDIIGRFIHLQVEEVEDKSTGKTFKKEKLIFPRFHQLDVVRKLSAHTKVNGSGKNYLIQHSAGSGKSNSIAWLAYRLSSLHNEQNEKVFDSVIVITDRRVLDQQLQNTIYQFEHKQGVVQKIDKDSSQLAYALGSAKSIIITTLQKFPYVIDKVGELPDRKYAVIIDEAHSSQGGEASRRMQEVLAAKSLETASEEETEFQDEEDEIREVMQTRGKQPNLSFFAFTATPKPKTLEVFGEPSADGKPRAFHLYSMKQAIEEGFIMDVLQNYTTYELYFKLSKEIEEDPELNKKQAAKAIGRFVSLHPHNIAQKTEIIIEHFRQVVSKKIGGKAKAMVVTGSRLHAKRYFNEFEKYIKEKGYDLRVLVAFSGKVVDNDYPDGVSEPELTGYGEKQLTDVFDQDEYKILIVADKYQTGFDQPLLHTMYVDKVLSGVKAVQTLSRLNRTCPGKEDTFVLDFANDREVILSSFQEYYEVSTVDETTDPNHLYDLKATLDVMQVYWQQEIDEFARIFFSSRNSLNPNDQAKLYSLIDPSIDRFIALEEEKADEFKKGIRTWTNLYAYLSQILPFKDASLEKFYVFAKYLQTKLPRKELSERFKLGDEVAMEYYRLQKIAEGAIELEEQGEFGLKNVTEAGIQKDNKEEKALLSEIINVLNDRFATDFTDADKLFFDQVEEELAAIEKLQLQAQSNSIENFKYGFKEELINAMINRMDNNQDIFEKFMDNNEFGEVVFNYMLKKVYDRLNNPDIKKE